MAHRALPPLTAIRAFEAAARHLSMTGAARELSVTPGAVSRQIRELEQSLGVTLFLRQPQGLVLTTAGETLSAGAGEALDRLALATGRARLVPANLLDPAEMPDEDFPFVLTTGRELEHWHTGAMTRRAGVLDALQPSPTASLAPEVLRRLGVAPGGRLRLSTRRGAVELSARADPDLPEGLVFMPFAYREAAANLLTNPQLDPFGKIPEFKYCAVRVEAV